VVTRLDSELPRLTTQRDKLKQIVLNLLKNAAEAMPEGGTVTIGTRDHVNRDGQSYVEIVVSDTGPGMPPEIMENLFKPVASTKGGGHGGLGLSIINELAAALNISVTCTSDPSGTIFQLLVPRILADR
jgi:signal transduction histidine kinase